MQNSYVPEHILNIDKELNRGYLLYILPLTFAAPASRRTPSRGADVKFRRGGSIHWLGQE